MDYWDHGGLTWQEKLEVSNKLFDIKKNSNQSSEVLEPIEMLDYFIEDIPFEYFDSNFFTSLENILQRPDCHVKDVVIFLREILSKKKNFDIIKFVDLFSLPVQNADIDFLKWMDEHEVK